MQAQSSFELCCLFFLGKFRLLTAYLVISHEESPAKASFHVCPKAVDCDAALATTLKSLSKALVGTKQWEHLPDVSARKSLRCGLLVLSLLDSCKMSQCWWILVLLFSVRPRH